MTATAREHVRQMLRIRRFEEKCAELYSAGKIRGFLHLYVGEEAIAAGVMSVLGPEDAIVSTYREHGHAIARGIPMDVVMAEMYGKREGCSRGRGGSMHLFDVSRRFFGGNAIVAGGLPLATGLALADVLRERQAKGITPMPITACFFGDGATAEGEFHESMNLAVLWKLPVLFLCENNHYAMGTAIERFQSETDLARKAESYKMRAEHVDGMDPFAVAEATERAVAHIREHHEPYFLELVTYRFRAHSMFDAELYRARTEVDRWKLRDPIKHTTQEAIGAGVLTEEDLAELEAEVKRELDDAVAFAEAGTWEPIADLTTDVMTTEAAR